MYDRGKRPDVSQAQSQKEKTHIIPTYDSMNDAKLCISDPPFDKMKTTTKTYHDTATVQSKNHYVLCKTTQLVGGRRRRRRRHQRRLVGQMYVQNAHLLQRKVTNIPTELQFFFKTDLHFSYE